MKKTAFKTQVRYFKRWTRKGYAAFSSMQKVVVISTISLACSFLAKPTGVFAQSNQDSVVTILEEVQVMADDPLQTETMQLMLLETAVMQCDIERSPVQALNELLDQLPNLDIRQRGPFGIQADISYRGGNFDQTLLLLNGINFTDPQTGHYTLNLPISPDIIQRIELYKNTTAFLFGTAPFSGLLNIITRCDTTPHFDFHFMGGMYGLYRVNADMNVRTGKFSHLVSMEYGHADGYMENTDFNTVNAYYQTIGRFKAGILELQAGFSDKKYGANGFYSLKFPNQYESTQTFLASVKWKGGEKVKWIPSIYYRFNKDCFELVKGQSPTKNNWHFNQIFGLNILSYFDSKIGRTSLSGDVRVEDVVSTSLGNLLDEPIPTKVPNVQYLYGRTRTNFGLSASQSFVLGGFTGDLTLLLQHFTDIRNKYYLLPAV
ncbi:MAG: TonB-dependent receptor plug domain-containing protein, partial [Bacteroidales bacterium]